MLSRNAKRRVFSDRPSGRSVADQMGIYRPQCTRDLAIRLSLWTDFKESTKNPGTQQRNLEPTIYRINTMGLKETRGQKYKATPAKGENPSVPMGVAQ